MPHEWRLVARSDTLANQMKEVLVSKTATESLYFKLEPDNPSLDGRVQRGDESFDVPFWSYTTRMTVNPITTTTFHKDLWNGDLNDPDWVDRFWKHTKPFTQEELDSLKDPSKYTGLPVDTSRPAAPKPPKQEASTVATDESKTNKVKTARVSFLGEVKAISNPSPSAIDNLVSLVPGGPDVAERANARLHGQHGKRGNLATLLRWWRPRMMMDGGFRRCLVTLADHPELYPLQNICAWLHHETTGLWPNEGCHHPGMKNCRRKVSKLVHGKKPVHGSIISDSEFAKKLQKLQELKPSKKSAQEMGTSVSNEINFKALAFLTASGVKVRVKSGLLSSNNRLVRIAESGVSYTTPGDMSRVRHPVRSTAYRAASPGGGGSGRRRIGGETVFRCPPGYANGGGFTDRHFTTCGPKLFEKPGATDPVVVGTRSAANVAPPPAGMLINATNADKPLQGVDVPPGTYTGPAAVVQGANAVPPVGKDNPNKVLESVVNNASLIYEDKKATGKLVRRDGFVMDLSVPVDKIASLKGNRDMQGGYLVTRVDDPMKMGDALMPTLNSDLKGFVLALPGDNHVMVSKTSKSTPEAIKGVNRRFNALKQNEQPFAYGSALQQAVGESKGALSINYHMPGIKHPDELLNVQRDGAQRTVVRWVYELFLKESAPARDKTTKPWTVVTNPNA